MNGKKDAATLASDLRQQAATDDARRLAVLLGKDRP